MPVPSRVVRTEERRNGAVRERIAWLRFGLLELEPKIWRRIDMPLSTTPTRLHEAIHTTMGWTCSYLGKFDSDDRCYGEPWFKEFDDETPAYRSNSLRLDSAIERRVERLDQSYEYGG